MKKTLLLKTLFLLALVMLGGSKMYADEYSYTFTAKQFTADGTKKLNNVDWTLTGGGGYWAYDGTKGQQFGSAGKPYKTLTFSTSGISGTITKIKINTSGAKSIDATLEVTVGGNSFGDTKKLTNTATDYTFEGNASGEISFNYTQNSAKAIYIKSITITYTPSGETPKTDRDLAFAEPNFVVEWDGSSVVDFTEPVLSGETAGVSYSSSKESVATVDAGGVVSIKGYGTTTITASAEADETYNADEASYTINVIELRSNVEYETALVAEKNGVYYAMTTELVSSKLMAATVDVVNGKVIDTNDETIKWQVNESAGTIRNGENYVKYTSNESTSISLDDAACEWYFNKGRWYIGDDNGRWLGLGSSVSGGVESYYFRAYKGTYPAALAMPFAKGYVRNATVDRFGTICLPRAVAADDMSGMTVYTVVGKKMDGDTPVSLVLEEVETMEAGKPYIFKATADKIIAAYNGEPVAEPVANNGLVGVLSGITLTEASNAHVLSNNAVKKVTGNVTVGNNRAYINMGDVPVYVEGGNAKRLIEIGYGDVVNGIESIATAEQALVDVYSITGVRVRSAVNKVDATDGLKKGIYIVGGRKVIVR